MPPTAAASKQPDPRQLLKQLLQQLPRRLICCALAGSRAGPPHHLCLSVRSDSRKTSAQPAVVRRATSWRGLVLTSTFASARHETWALHDFAGRHLEWGNPSLRQGYSSLQQAYSRGISPYSRSTPTCCNFKQGCHVHFLQYHVPGKTKCTAACWSR